MKDRKKRMQREEVRKILATMRLELAAQRLAQEHNQHAGPILRVNEMIRNSTRSVMAG